MHEVNIVLLVGACFIGEFLKVNCVLKTLDLSQNNVGDDGISVIADALLCNQTLTELWVGECGVTVKGRIFLLHLM